MLETLRVFGAGLLAQAGEQEKAAAALARYAQRVAEEAAAGLEGSTAEVAAARRLDAEDATLRQVLAWATEQDAALALRVAVALAPWWSLRGRAVGQYPLLCEAAERAAPGSGRWCTAQFWLGYMAINSDDQPQALDHFTAVIDAMRDRRRTVRKNHRECAPNGMLELATTNLSPTRRLQTCVVRAAWPCTDLPALGVASSCRVGSGRSRR